MYFSSVSKGSEAHVILPCRQKGAGQCLSVLSAFTCTPVPSCLPAFGRVTSFKETDEVVDI